MLGDGLSRVRAQASKETNKQASKQTTRRRADEAGSECLVEERSGEDWERPEKVDGLVTAVGEMQPGQNGSGF